jgi:predicted nuclease with TOPRIM domain
MDFYDRTLISLKRQYSKDEVFAALIKKLKETEVEVGKLKAEIDYLENELQLDEEGKEVKRLGRIEARKDEMYKTQLERCKKQQKEIKKLRQERNDMIAKCYTLEQKYIKECKSIEGTNETRIIEIDREWLAGILYKVSVTECCKIGPITNEKYCPECGKKIIR